MKHENKPTLVYCVDDLKKLVICGCENEIYVSNEMPPEIIMGFSEILSHEIKIIIFDPLEYREGTINLKKNGRVQFKLNKTYTVYKQTYYYYSKNKRKYMTTMWGEYIKKNCNYTNYIQNYRFMQSQIFYASYDNTTELVNEDKKLNISRQSIYNYERESCRLFLAQREAELWKQIEKLEIKSSGYYHYDEEYIKINKEVYVRLSLITDSLKGLKLNTIITDGHRAYPEIIDELGAKHQLCRFHIMQTLMRPLTKKIRGLKRRIEGIENKINKKQEKIDKLKAEYPYKQGRPPKSDKKACKNVDNRKILNMEKSDLSSKLSKYEKELNEIIEYKDKIKKIFTFKTWKTCINRFNKLLDKKDELPTIIYDFLKNLSKKIDRALAFTKDPSIPKTNNLIELFYKVTFPGKIKRIYRTVEGVENKIRMNNIRWMERNVIQKHEENMSNQ